MSGGGGGGVRNRFFPEAKINLHGQRGVRHLQIPAQDCQYAASQVEPNPRE